MPDVVSHLLKINLRARSKESVQSLLCNVLGGELGLSSGDLAVLRRGGVIGERWSMYDAKEGGA